MKKIKKNLLGALGLCVVAASTIYAATLPAPGASAATQTSTITDTLVVRVVAGDSYVELESPQGDRVANPAYQLAAGYGGVEDLVINATRLDFSGNVVSGPTAVWSYNPNYVEGTQTINVNLNDLGGYGQYVFTLTGKNHSGLPIETSWDVIYTNVPDPTSDIDSEGHVDVIIPPAPSAPQIEKVDIKIYDDGGNLVAQDVAMQPSGQITLPTGGLPAGDYVAKLTYFDDVDNVIGEETRNFTIEGGETIVVPVPSDEFEPIYRTEIDVKKDGTPVDTIELPGDGSGRTRIPVEKWGTGTYEVTVKYYDKDGNLIGISSTIIIYVDKIPSAGSPDTGGLFKGLDISRADYLATGLLVFFVFAVVALGVLMRSRRSAKSSKKRH